LLIHLSKLIELDKCEKELIYFCENYIKIINVDKGLIPFKMYDFQKDMLKQFENNRFKIVDVPAKLVNVFYKYYRKIKKQKNRRNPGNYDRRFI
jgi:hypothetical protein